MENILNKCTPNDLIEIYTRDEDVNTCFVGYVLKTNADDTLLAVIGSSGLYDGYYAIRTESVVTIAAETEYLKKIKTLYNLKKQSHDLFTGSNEDIFLASLEFARDNKHIVSLALLDSDEYTTRGFVEDVIDDETVVIKEVTVLGNSDGKYYVNIEDISQIAVDGEEEQDMKLLFRAHNQQ